MGATILLLWQNSSRTLFYVICLLSHSMLLAVVMLIAAVVMKFLIIVKINTDLKINFKDRCLSRFFFHLTVYFNILVYAIYVLSCPVDIMKHDLEEVQYKILT